MQTLRNATTPTRNDDGTFTLHVEDGWQQGRGAYGGLVLGALATAMEASEPDTSRRLRTLTGELPGPTPVGPATITVETLRRGSGVTTLHARLVARNEICAAATAVLGKARASDDLVLPESPLGPPWNDVPLLPMGSGIAPTFTQHLEFRALPPFPFTSGKEGVTQGYIRPHQRSSALRSSDLIALCDSYWPSYFVRLGIPRPMATIAFTVQILVDPATLDPEEPLFYRAREIANVDGFVSEIRELFTPAGKLVAVNPQTFVIIQ